MGEDPKVLGAAETGLTRQTGLEKHSGSSLSEDLFSDIRGSTTAERIIDILLKATCDGKIHWFRDAEWYAVTYIPLLAVSFRLSLPHPRLSGDGRLPSPDKIRGDYLDVCFMDNKEKRLMRSAYPSISKLAQAVWMSFLDDYQRDRDERLEWLERALLKFLPMVLSSDL